MNDLDLEAAKRTTLDDRVPFLEISGIIEVKPIKRTMLKPFLLLHFVLTF